MENNSIIAILGLIGTFVVPFIVVLFQNYYENKKYKIINDERRKVISGKWEGIFAGEPPDGFNSQEKIISGELVAKRKKVMGELKFGEHPLNCEGGFRNDRFLVLIYNNARRLQFGTLILELKPTNEELVGKLMGFGPLSEKIVFGTIVLKKKK